MIRLLKSLLFLAVFSTTAFAGTDSGDILDREDYDPNTPYYQIIPPSWAFSFRTGISRFPISSAVGNIYELGAEYMIHYQKIGILSLGAHLGIAPLSTSNSDNFKYGGLLRYQLHVFHNQIVVPTASLVYDGFRLKNDAGATANPSSFGFMFGGLLNLGFFDAVTARQGHESIGLLRSYLSLELRPLSLSSPAFSISGSVWYMGIRLEVE